MWFFRAAHQPIRLKPDQLMTHPGDEAAAASSAASCQQHNKINDQTIYFGYDEQC
jgi:hypothetical protein